MYQAFYRKWRPRDFDGVVGQSHITDTLKNEVATGRFSHAYLFTGSRGTGKTTCSKIVAKAINCERPVNGNPCNACAICKGIDEGSVLDVVEIDAASNNGVDSIRELREEAYFLPSIAKYRVYILDECHMLSPGAVNALLKILEEPPEHVIFILATTEIHKVLPTILSRCQRFDFKRIKSRVIADQLLFVAQREQLDLADDAALLMARLSDGGMRDALSLLDLCAGQGREITPESVAETAGLTGQGPLYNLADALFVPDPAGALAVVESLSENSVDFSRLCEQLVTHFRNLMLMKSLKDPDELISGTPEELERLREQAGKIALNRILSALDLLQETMGKLSRTAFKRTEFEMAIVRLCDERLALGLSGVFDRLDKLEKAARAGILNPAPKSATQPAMPPETPGSIVTKAAATPWAARPEITFEKPAAPVISPEGTGLREAGSFDEWARVLAELQKSNGALYGALVDSRAYTSGDMMLIDCQNEIFRSLLRQSVAAKESLRDAILAVTGQKFNLGPYNPEKYAVAQKKADPLAGMLKKASELNVPVKMNG